jgi:vacuolar protein-sorting-associated protein 4
MVLNMTIQIVILKFSRLIIILIILDPANKSSSFDFEGTEKTASNNDQDKEDDDLQLKVEKCIRKLDSGRNWDEVVGQGTAKAALEEALVLPFSFPWYYEGKISPPQGVLLYGPPGVGKTKLAEIAASTSNSQLVEIRGSDVRSKYYGESEKFIRVLFRRILELKRAVIFMDEIDGLLPRKGESNSKLGDGIVNEFLVQLQGNPSLTQHRFVLIGATNYPQYIDIAIMRRFQKLVRLSLPDVADRIKLFKTRLQPVNPPFGDVDYRRFATMTEG